MRSIAALVLIAMVSGGCANVWIYSGDTFVCNKVFRRSDSDNGSILFKLSDGGVITCKIQSSVSMAFDFSKCTNLESCTDSYHLVSRGK
jgi:hypothetical protein